MKMSEVFGRRNISASGKHIVDRDVHMSDLGQLNTPRLAKAAAHAINCHDKLVEALGSALNYISECPCDPDVYPEQLEAWNKLQLLDADKLLKQAKGVE